jgi:hypothetical protein
VLEQKLLEQKFAKLNNVFRTKSLEQKLLEAIFYNISYFSKICSKKRCYNKHSKTNKSIFPLNIEGLK